MQERFIQLTDYIQSKMHGDEVFLLNLQGEDSHFVRFNQAKVRQPGSVRQETARLQVMHGRRHAAVEMTLTGSAEIDCRRIDLALERMRERLPHLPEDPHLLVNESVCSTQSTSDSLLIDAADMVDEITQESQGLDMVGILATGGIYRGFSNSYGQRNWFSTSNFNLDWSLVHSADKAVKSTYAGKEWSSTDFRSKMELARRKLKALGLPPKILAPGEYRAFLSPTALWEILSLLGWGGFSMNAQKTKVSPLLKLAESEKSLSEKVSLYENVEGGSSAQFQSQGFVRPPSIPLVEDGRFAGSLISPRTAQEYGLETNGAAGHESPDSLDMKGGSIGSTDILETLDTGVHIGNLWYLNYSDRMEGRMTGMTRFATFWVENGEVVAPLNVMRFDDTIYRVLGENLVDLTKDRNFLLSAASYFYRSTASAHLPGALVRDFRFTL
jgi:predicted Zn-dependent protease